MLIADAAGKILACNRHLESLFRHPPGALTNQPIDVLIPPALRLGHHENVAHYVNAPTTRMMGSREFSGWCADGDTFPCEISLSPYRRGNDMFVVAAIRDVSGRKGIERQLQEARDQLHLVFEASPEPYFLVAPNGELKNCNAAAERMFGHDGSIEKRHRDVAQLLFAGPDSPDSFLQQFDHCQRARRTVVAEAILTPPGKGSFEAEYILEPLLGPDGSLLSILMICRDISHRKQAELHILQTKERAEKALQELQATRAVLLDAERLAALGRMVAGVAHEIRNPLNFIRNFTEAAIQDLTALGESESGQNPVVRDEVVLVRSDLEKVLAHSLRLEHIIRSMMLLARKEKGPVEQFSLNDIVRETADFALQGQSRANSSLGDVLQLDLDTSEPRIQGRPPDLARTFLNLIENGLYSLRKRKATDASFEPVLLVKTRLHGDEAEVEVRDNGLGMPERARAQLFTPFFTTKPTGEGTGLGLSICHETVADHQGRIEVASEEGSFAAFTVWLPVRMREWQPQQQG